MSGPYMAAAAAAAAAAAPSRGALCGLAAEHCTWRKRRQPRGRRNCCSLPWSRRCTQKQHGGRATAIVMASSYC
jgi:hypothetical protein